MPYEPAQPLAFFALEESTAVFTATFLNEVGSGVVASAVVWTLSDDASNVINSRLNVPIAGSGFTATIVLGALDTKRQNTEPYASNGLYVRVLKVAGLYNSVFGSNLPTVGVYRFGITPVPVE